MNYPVAMVLYTTTVHSEFGVWDMDKGDFPSMAFLSERKVVPPVGDYPSSDSELSSGALSEVYRDIDSCDWFLYGIFRGAKRRNPTGEIASFAGDFSSTYFSVSVAIVHDDASFIRKAFEWQVILPEMEILTEASELSGSEPSLFSSSSSSS
jgi:hypothetical protein